MRTWLYQDLQQLESGWSEVKWSDGVNVLYGTVWNPHRVLDRMLRATAQNMRTSSEGELLQLLQHLLLVLLLALAVDDLLEAELHLSEVRREREQGGVQLLVLVLQTQQPRRHFRVSRRSSVSSRTRTALLLGISDSAYRSPTLTSAGHCRLTVRDHWLLRPHPAFNLLTYLLLKKNQYLIKNKVVVLYFI